MSDVKTITEYAMLLDSKIQLDDNKPSSKFKRFSKQLAAFGEFVDPRGGKKPMILDEKWAQSIADNFKNGPIKRVPMVLGHPRTSAELAEKTRGWLEDLEVRKDGLYGIFDIRKQDTAEDIENGLLEQTSVAFDDNYQDKRTGKWFQNVLKHVGLVNDPYIKDMDAMEPVEMSGNTAAAVLFSDAPINSNEKENVMAQVTNDKDFPVEVKYQIDGSETTATIEPTASLEVPDDQLEAVQKQITDAVKPTDDGTGNGDEQLSEAEKKDKELSDREAAVAAAERELAEKQAEAEFTALLNDHKVVPAQHDAFIALSAQTSATVELSDGVTKSVSTLLSEFLGAMPKSIKLSEEEGVEGGDKDDVELTSEEKSLTDLGVSEEDLKETKKQEGDQ